MIFRYPSEDKSFLQPNGEAQLQAIGINVDMR